MRLGAIEAGGTKFVCGIADKEGNVLERVSFQTETPEITLQKVYNFFKIRELKLLELVPLVQLIPIQVLKLMGI